MPRTLKPELRGHGRRIAIVASRFTKEISQKLLDGAVQTLLEHGVEDSDITVLWVPGSFELPLTSARLAARGDCAAVIALGAVIRGETDHYEHVCGQTARGILQASLAQQKPIVFGVLTCDSARQALARAGGEKGNKGADCALAALEMIAVLEAIDDSAYT